MTAQTATRPTTALDRHTGFRLAALADLGIIVSRTPGQPIQFHLADSSTGVWCNRPVLGQEPVRAFPTRIGGYLCTACSQANHADGGQPWSGMRSLIRLAETILSAEPAQLRVGWILLDHEHRVFDLVTIVDAETSGQVLVRYGHVSPERVAEQAAKFGAREFYVDADLLGFEVPAGYLKR